MKYKVIVHLVGIPPQLRREQHVARAASTFGVYLGSISQDDPANVASWMVVVGTHDLANLPSSVLIVAGRVHIPVKVQLLKWSKAPLYKDLDQPGMPVTFQLPD